MRKPTLPNSNSVFLNGREWLIAVAIFLAISFVLYFGWYPLGEAAARERITAPPAGGSG